MPALKWCLIKTLAFSFKSLSAFFLLTALVSAQQTNEASSGCEKLSSDPAVCKAIKLSIQNSINKVLNNKVSFEQSLGAELEQNILKNPDVLNKAIFESKYVTSRIGNIPFQIQAKVFDREEADSVIGLAFSYEKNLVKTFVSDQGQFNHFINVDINLNGTLTRRAEENPRNFIETKLSVAASAYTNLPMQSIQTISALNSSDQECFNSEACMNAKFDLYDAALKSLSGFTYISYGLKGGLETDQSFDAQYKTISGFFFASYEAWDTQSWFGSIGLRPSILLSLDSIDPNDKSLRALAGDNTAFMRWSGELSVNYPVKGLFDLALNFSFNYRTYQEIAPSQLVDDAGLASHHLRTYTVSTSDNIYLSYSSGALPFDQQSQSLVELGWRYAF